MVSNIFSLDAHNAGKQHQKYLRNWGEENVSSTSEKPSSGKASSGKPQTAAQARVKDGNSVRPLFEVDTYSETEPYRSANTVPVDMDLSSEVSPLMSFIFS